jgi:hypothetical protein
VLYDGSLDTLIEHFEDQRSLIVPFAEPVSDPTRDGIPAPHFEGRTATNLLMADM